MAVAARRPGSVSREVTSVPAFETVELEGRLRLPCVLQGDPAGVPVVLLHAYGDSWRSFELLLARLPPALRAVAYTQRGHGDASKPRAGYRMQDGVHDLAGLMDAIGLERAVLAGSSSGGYVAQRFAVEHPERTAGLFLIATPRTLRRTPPALLEEVSRLRDPVDREWVRDLLDACVHVQPPADFMDAMARESRKVPARVWRAALKGLVEAPAPTELGAITAPTLVVAGERDALLPAAEPGALAAAIPGARLVVYPETGHMPHWERPERVARDLVAFAGRRKAGI